jgi:hypothetical protein
LAVGVAVDVDMVAQDVTIIVAHRPAQNFRQDVPGTSYKRPHKFRRKYSLRRANFQTYGPVASPRHFTSALPAAADHPPPAIGHQPRSPDGFDDGQFFSSRAPRASQHRAATIPHVFATSVACKYGRPLLRPNGVACNVSRRHDQSQRAIEHQQDFRQ